LTGSIPLSVLDLVPITSGSTPREALGNTLDLARHAEAFGYHRYWIAEHHMAPGVAGSAPPVVIALVAGATQHIRVGSGAVQMGHQTPLAVVEQFGILDAVHPGRIDLGLGRSGRSRNASRAADAAAAAASGPGPDQGPRTTRRGLHIPARFDPAPLLASPRFRAQAKLLQQPGAETPDYADQVDETLALLHGTHRTPDGIDVHAVPGEGAGVEVWILGSSGGASAQVAGRRGLRFAANYHVSPATVLESIEAYRAAFRPSPTLERPHVLVSADVVVAATDAAARHVAAPYGLWVRSIRTGLGAMRFASPDEAAAHAWTPDDRALVADRVDTQFVGPPATVARQLEVLAAETGADELMVTTIAHEHADRVRSFQLLAHEWATRATRTPETTRARLAPATRAAVPAGAHRPAPGGSPA
jgi:alkanesulfonate monooxygenase SsuD/methylene tetrahydromethanopterin reductase-like flavin-dependent oxidoreductase (luciferase family)